MGHEVVKNHIKPKIATFFLQKVTLCPMLTVLRKQNPNVLVGNSATTNNALGKDKSTWLQWPHECLAQQNLVHAHLWFMVVSKVILMFHNSAPPIYFVQY